MYYMSTVTFYLEEGYILDFKDNDLFFKTDKYSCYVRVKECRKRKCYRFENRFFINRQTAEAETKKLYFSIQNQLIKKGIPIWYKNQDHGYFLNSESYCPALITNDGKKRPELISPELKNKRIENEVIGYAIYELITPIDDVKFIIQDIEFKRKFELDMPDINKDYENDGRINTSYKMLNLSNSIRDEKIAFILKITAFEVLVSEEQYKPEKFKSLIKLINKKILKVDDILKLLDEKSDEARADILSLKSSFGYMSRLSISEKCRNLISDNYNVDKYVDNKSSVEFFDECYKIRSSFIHAGKYNIADISNKSIYLGDLLLKILDSISEN